MTDAALRRLRQSIAEFKWAAYALALLLANGGSVGFAEVAHASSKASLLVSARSAPKALLPSHAKPGSGIAGRIDGAALDSATLEIALPEGRTLVATLRHLARDDRYDTLTWTGISADSPDDLVVLTRRKGAMAGFVIHGGRTFEIHAGSAGSSLLFEVDASRLPPTGATPLLPDLDAARRKSGDEFVGQLSAEWSPVVQDLLVVYTSAAASRYGQATLESMVGAAVEAANSSYRSSNIGVTLSLMDVRPADFAESPDSRRTLEALSASLEIRAIRDSVGADLVILVADMPDGCGLAFQLSSNTIDPSRLAYGLVGHACLSNNSLTHEIGHIQGVLHDRESSGTAAGAFPYAYGFRRCATDGTGFRDIMAYACTNAAREARLSTFSSPNVSYMGHPTGIGHESDPGNSADAARAINGTGATVASYRTSVTTPPSSPTSLSATVTSSGRVNLAWSSSSSGVSGFRVERSTDGVNYTEVARLGSGLTSYLDPAVTLGATYSYRVAAFNSAGVSEYSNVATITLPLTPPVPPPMAPTGLSATVVSSAQVNLAWNDNSGDEQGFRIERAADGGAFSLVAVVGPDRRSYQDGSTAPSKAYSYRVTAYNSSGASAYSNLVNVTTPLALPSVPMGLTAKNNGGKTAVVSWTTNASVVGISYEVMREKYKKKKWRTPVTAASIPSGAATSILDASGKGIFRYSIRACNVAGCSAYSAPATVQVTK
jgi:peptidyl-Asp metalloendopeptidase